jgi:hypothetical protein
MLLRDRAGLGVWCVRSRFAVAGSGHVSERVNV